MGDYRSEPGVSGAAMGGVMFAAVMLFLIGVFQSVAGLSAIVNDAFFTLPEHYALDLDPTAWGWIHLILGVLLVLTGLGLFAGQGWAGMVALLVTVLSAVANFVTIPYYPFWSIVEIAIALWVIWALTRPGVLRY